MPSLVYLMLLWYLFGLLNMIGVSRKGFSLLHCSNIYATFVRPKFECDLTISRLTVADMKYIENLQDHCICLLVGSHRTSSTTTIKYITTLPFIRHRIDVLVTCYCLHAYCLPNSCLLPLLSSTLPVPRIKTHLETNSLFRALSSPPPPFNTRLKTFFR